MAVVKSPKNNKLKVLWYKNFKKKNKNKLVSNLVKVEHRAVFKPMDSRNAAKGKDLVMFDYGIVMWSEDFDDYTNS